MNFVNAYNQALTYCDNEETRIKFHGEAISYVFAYFNDSITRQEKNLTEFRAHFISGEPLNIEYCSECNIKMVYIVDEERIMCPKCHVTTKSFSEKQVVAFNESTIIYNNFCYEKIGRFRDWLKFIQGKKGNVPTSIIEIVRNECIKDRIDFTRLHLNKVRYYLKLNKLVTYYDYAFLILSKLNNTFILPDLTIGDEEFFCEQFNLIYDSFIVHCPYNRTNFFKHTHVLRKIAEEFPKYNYLVNFCPLLKNENNLRRYDDLWEKICADIGYTFRKSC
jgi:hypothetical protein